MVGLQRSTILTLENLKILGDKCIFESALDAFHSSNEYASLRIVPPPGNGSTELAPRESGAGFSGTAGGLGMSAEMELSFGGEASGRRLLRAAAKDSRPRRSRHYTDVEIGGEESGAEEDPGDDNQVVY